MAIKLNASETVNFVKPEEEEKDRNKDCPELETELVRTCPGEFSWEGTYKFFELTVDATINVYLEWDKGTLEGIAPDRYEYITKDVDISGSVPVYVGRRVKIKSVLSVTFPQICVNGKWVNDDGSWVIDDETGDYTKKPAGSTGKVNGVPFPIPDSTPDYSDYTVWNDAFSAGADTPGGGDDPAFPGWGSGGVVRSPKVANVQFAIRDGWLLCNNPKASAKIQLVVERKKMRFMYHPVNEMSIFQGTQGLGSDYGKIVARTDDGCMAEIYPEMRMMDDPQSEYEVYRVTSEAVITENGAEEIIKEEGGTIYVTNSAQQEVPVSGNHLKYSRTHEVGRVGVNGLRVQTFSVATEGSQALNSEWKPLCSFTFNNTGIQATESAIRQVAWGINQNEIYEDVKKRYKLK